MPDELKHEDTPQPGHESTKITANQDSIDNETRQQGLSDLKRKMGGDTPWYKEKSSSLDSPMGRINLNHAMTTTVLESNRVPRGK